MAITPGEAAKLTDAELTLVMRMETKIDNILRDNYTGAEGQVINISIETRLAPRAMIELEKRFREAGWYVAYRSDSGQFELSKNPPPDHNRSHHDYVN